MLFERVTEKLLEGERVGERLGECFSFVLRL
jgi:hypothetical protein